MVWKTLLVSLCFTLCIVGAQEGKLVFNEGLFNVTWALSEENGEQTMEFTVKAEDVGGWIGIGWSMINGTSGDLIIAEVDAEDKTKLNVGDFWGFRQGPPVKDKIQNADNSLGWRDPVAKTAYFEFTRKVISNDTEEDYDIPLNGIYIMWAWSDAETWLDNHEHRDRSSVKVIFVAEDSEEASKDSEHIEL